MRYSIVAFDIASHLLIGVLVAVLLWPYAGYASLLAVLGAVAYLVYAWTNADLIVAARAGFRKPAPVQERYLDFLGTGTRVFTHPSSMPVVGTLAGPDRRLVLITAGALKLISDEDLRRLIPQLARRDEWGLFVWTFHLATGASRLFTRVDKDDPFADWGRRTLLTGLLGGVVAVAIGFLIAGAISMSPVVGRPIDISAIVPVFWVPFVYLGARFLWRLGNRALIKTAAGNWNMPIKFEGTVLLPLSVPTGGHPNLDLLRHGMLMADKVDTASHIDRHLPL